MNNKNIEEIIEAVFLHGKETPDQSHDLPEGQLTIHDAVESLTNLIQAEKEQYLDKIKELKVVMEEHDWEAVHSVYDSIMWDIARKSRPKLVKKLDKIREGATFWYA